MQPRTNREGRHPAARSLPVILVVVVAASLGPSAAASEPSFRVTPGRYDVPGISLKNQEGKPVRLQEVLGGADPVALNFFFASCRTICPVMSSAFSGMREKLGDDAGRVRLVSISIDPEQDTPEVLREYAKRFSAGPEWTFLTGTQEQIDVVLKSFLADSGGKFNHQPLFFFRDPSKDRWLRVDGLAGAGDLAAIAKGLGRPLRVANSAR